MLKGLWIAFRRVVDNARAGDADAADPYVLLCNTPEFSDRNNGDFDCDVPWIRGPGSEDDPGGGPPRAAGWPRTRAPHHLETSLPGVFAVGDVRGGSEKRVASAVGEDSTAIALAHQALKE
jgi:hypothetical protein